MYLLRLVLIFSIFTCVISCSKTEVTTETNIIATSEDELMKNIPAEVVKIIEEIELTNVTSDDQNEELSELIWENDNLDKKALLEYLKKKKSTTALNISATLHYQFGDIDQGDMVVSEMFLKGAPPQGIIWSWLHSDDENILRERTIAIAELTFMSYSALSDKEKILIDSYFCEMLDIETTDNCNHEAILFKINEIKQ